MLAECLICAKRVRRARVVTSIRAAAKAIFPNAVLLNALIVAEMDRWEAVVAFHRNWIKGAYIQILRAI
jgi:hypothetical protein